MSTDHNAATATPLVVSRWSRYGHDRAYVKAGDRDLGFRDLQTGEIHCPDADDTDAVEQATAELLARVDESRGAGEYRPRHGRIGSTVETIEADECGTGEAGLRPLRPGRHGLAPDRDLAGNRPGQAARERADALRAAAPVRTLFARAVGAKTDERAWRIGADGEDDVARRLSRLGDRWRVLHAVPVGDRDAYIDHVVIGPAGVFTVNAESHPDAEVSVARSSLTINGSDQPYVRNSRHEAARAARLLTAATGLDVQVLGVVAILGARRGFAISEEPADVIVLHGRDVGAHLGKAAQVLEADAVEQIYAAARHLSTWQPKTVAHEEFHAAG